ncbi:MAG TPA: signal peptidase I [Candidatus Stackebrandtia faecavium]|nr:signal peptidase I [Candidatus Stackebrandtia faecavium]
MDDHERAADDERQTGDRTDTSESVAAGEKKKRSFLRELPVLVAIAVVVALVLRTFVLQSFWIPSGSMENTLQLDDYVVANKVVYEMREPQRGEIVVFHAPPSWRHNVNEQDYIKRVIAVGGDTVAYDAETQHLSVNGHALDESSYLYTDPQTGKQDSPSLDNQEFEVTVPDNRLWVMGDHRWASGDSREHYMRTDDPVASTIPLDQVVGEAFVRVWPINRIGTLGKPDIFDEVPAPA